MVASPDRLSHIDLAAVARGSFPDAASCAVCRAAAAVPGSTARAGNKDLAT